MTELPNAAEREQLESEQEIVLERMKKRLVGEIRRALTSRDYRIIFYFPSDMGEPSPSSQVRLG